MNSISTGLQYTIHHRAGSESLVLYPPGVRIVASDVSMS